MTTFVTITATGKPRSGKTMLLSFIRNALTGPGVAFVDGSRQGENALMVALDENVLDLLLKRQDARDLAADVSERLDATVKRLHLAQDNEVKAIKQRDDARSQLADLKRRLHDAEITNAKQSGYIMHVQEREDATLPREPMTETRMVPSLQAPRRMNVQGEQHYWHQMAPNGEGSGSKSDALSRPPHWIGYGHS